MWLLWGPSLSVLHYLFVFIRIAEATVLSGGPRLVRWWEPARAEAQLVRGMLPFIFADVGVKTAPIVLAQDVAGAASKLCGGSRLRFSAWCLAVAAPPQPEIEAVVSDVRLLGKASTMPAIALSVDPLPLARAPSLPLVSSTRVPSHLFSACVPWTLLIAHRWRFP
jgi:hypothetical protein